MQNAISNQHLNIYSKRIGKEQRNSTTKDICSTTLVYQSERNWHPESWEAWRATHHQKMESVAIEWEHAQAPLQLATIQSTGQHKKLYIDYMTKFICYDA